VNLVAARAVNLLAARAVNLLASCGDFAVWVIAVSRAKPERLISAVDSLHGCHHFQWCRVWVRGPVDSALLEVVAPIRAVASGATCSGFAVEGEARAHLDR
jgi:hypothetical protein